MIVKVIGIVLVVFGGLVLAYGGFTYVKSTNTADLGPIEFSFKNKERVNVPVWAGVGSLVIGGVLLISGRRRGIF